MHLHVVLLLFLNLRTGEATICWQIVALQKRCFSLQLVSWNVLVIDSWYQKVIVAVTLILDLRYLHSLALHPLLQLLRLLLHLEQLLLLSFDLALADHIELVLLVGVLADRERSKKSINIGDHSWLYNLSFINQLLRLKIVLLKILVILLDRGDEVEHPLDVGWPFSYMLGCPLHCRCLQGLDTVGGERIRVDSQHPCTFLCHHFFWWWICTLPLLDVFSLWQKIAILSDPRQELDCDEGLGGLGHVVAVTLEGKVERFLIGDHRGSLLLRNVVVWRWIAHRNLLIQLIN